MLQGLAPLVHENTRLVILGSFPGVRSLQTQQYYAHPQNQFWRLVFQAFSVLSRQEISLVSYEKRSELLLQLGVGLWDVYAACEREGSLDSAIENAQLNDLASLKKRCPHLQAIAHNGGESYRHAKHVRAALSAAGPPQGATAPSGGSGDAPAQSVGLQIYKLPSSSPANASWSFERKLQVWQEVIRQHCTIPA
jgi:hypoxanthine-DNA glycosylase